MGMNLHPNPSLSHIIFSWPSTSSSLWSSTSSSTWSMSNDFVPLPFPSFANASLTHLTSFVHLSRGFFKLGFCKLKKNESVNENINIWDCSSLSLFSKVSGDRINSMERFSSVLVGRGWTMFKTKNGSSFVSGNFGSTYPVSVYLYRKVDSSRVEIVDLNCNVSSSENGKFRIRELRLPSLDFRNAPLRILQYILLMTDDIFYLACCWLENSYDGWVIVDSIIVKELDTSPVLTGSLGMDESSTMSGGEERRGGKLSSDGRVKDHNLLELDPFTVSLTGLAVQQS
ncbi:hypothetical protein IFM89_039398 [Coptis chinensis]|uniref:Uncharacterized protein n=1 Tax=Coptis chinensis TaxID=261450 RepID=A0A835I9V9_9MAGN|nr:hypothetical protein IFM89_039398 [Coptis chinensis]